MQISASSAGSPARKDVEGGARAVGGWAVSLSLSLTRSLSLSCALSQGLSTTLSLGKTRAGGKRRGRRRTLVPLIRRWRQRIWRNYINTTPDTFFLLLLLLLLFPPSQRKRKNSTGTDVRPKARRLPPSGPLQCQDCEYMIGLRGVAGWWWWWWWGGVVVGGGVCACCTEPVPEPV